MEHITGLKKSIHWNNIVEELHGPVFKPISFWAKVRKLEKDCYKGDLDHAGVRFFRKDVFDDLGGFNEKLVAGEDYDLYNRFKKTDYTIGVVKAEELHKGEPKSVSLNIIKKRVLLWKIPE